MKLNAFGRFWDRRLAGSYLNRKVILYEFDTAMHGAINISTRWGYLCLAWPSIGLGLQMPLRWYAYLSPNGTPWASTFAVGPGVDGEDRKMAQVRRALWGHGYNSHECDPQVLDAAIAAAAFREPWAIKALARMIDERNKEA